MASRTLTVSIINIQGLIFPARRGYSFPLLVLSSMLSTILFFGDATSTTVDEENQLSTILQTAFIMWSFVYMCYLEMETLQRNKQLRAEASFLCGGTNSLC